MSGMLVTALVIAALVILYIVLVLSLRDRLLNLKFDFNQLKQAPLRFGKDFLWGSATASHQIEGGCANNNWYQFESAVNEQGKPRILNGQKAGLCCDAWNRYKEDVQLMKASRSTPTASPSSGARSSPGRVSSTRRPWTTTCRK